MSKQEYTKEQIKELENNLSVKKCSEKYITFTDEFKTKAIELNKKWYVSKEIFIKFWFPEYIICSQVPWESLKRWRFKAKHEWISSLNNTKKWRKKKEYFDVSKMTKDEYIEYLETENAVLKELKKLVDWEYP